MSNNLMNTKFHIIGNVLNAVKKFKYYSHKDDIDYVFDIISSIKEFGDITNVKEFAKIIKNNGIKFYSTLVNFLDDSKYYGAIEFLIASFDPPSNICVYYMSYIYNRLKLKDCKDIGWIISNPSCFSIFKQNGVNISIFSQLTKTYNLLANIFYDYDYDFLGTREYADSISNELRHFCDLISIYPRKYKNKRINFSYDSTTEFHIPDNHNETIFESFLNFLVDYNVNLRFWMFKCTCCDNLKFENVIDEFLRHGFKYNPDFLFTDLNSENIIPRSFIIAKLIDSNDQIMYSKLGNIKWNSIKILNLKEKDINESNAINCLKYQVNCVLIGNRENTIH